MSKEDDDKSENKKKVRRAFSLEYRMQELMEKLNDRVEANESELRQRSEEWQHRSEEIQRNIDFIVRQQAQFNTDIERRRERQERYDERWSQTEQGIRALLAIAEMHEQQISALDAAHVNLAESQARTDRQVSETGKQMAETDRRMAETDERINALVNTVERIISERRNGGGQGA